jgi:hypothetical protein
VPASKWQPILDGELATAASAAVHELADAIAAAKVEPPHAPDVALFWAYAGDLGDAHFDSAIEAACSAVEELGGSALHGGAVGAAWTLAHLADPSAVDLLAGFDVTLADALRDDPDWFGGHDLILGLAGTGMYWLERPPSPAREIGLARVVERLAASCDRDADGLSWRTPPALLVADQRVRYPDGYRDCGLAHGVPGVVGMLSRLDDPRALSLATDGARWTIAQRSRGRMPAIAGGEPARTAWCYGDPGVSLALARVARDEALVLARDSAARDPEQCGVRDAALCHGASGLAHVFNRWFQATGEPAFRDAARAWLTRALEMPRPLEPCLLEGAVGLALALLAALGHEEPRWDRMMLCDLA